MTCHTWRWKRKHARRAPRGGHDGPDPRATYKTMPKVKVAWVFDKDAKRAQRLAAMLDARPTTRLDDVLEDGNVQAVDICLPTDLHRTFTEKAAAAGKHVFCEKPIALTVEDAEAMVEACEKANVTLMVGHVVRFFRGLPGRAPAGGKRRHRRAQGDPGRPHRALFPSGGATTGSPMNRGAAGPSSTLRSTTSTGSAGPLATWCGCTPSGPTGTPW